MCVWGGGARATGVALHTTHDGAGSLPSTGSKLMFRSCRWCRLHMRWRLLRSRVCARSDQIEARDKSGISPLVGVGGLDSCCACGRFLRVWWSMVVVVTPLYRRSNQHRHGFGICGSSTMWWSSTTLGVVFSPVYRDYMGTQESMHASYGGGVDPNPRR